MGFNALTDVADLTGKVIIVTGSTAGLGFATVQVLVRKGAKVYIAARNAEKAASCIQKITDQGTGPGNGQAIFHHLDLEDPRGAKTSALEFMKGEDRLDVLVNNAAIVAVDYQLTDYGIQKIMLVNYISTFVFTNTLLPLLRKTDAQHRSDVRIVNLGSDSHNFVPDTGLHFQTKNDFNLSFLEDFAGSFKRYGLSKLAVNLWSRELQKRLAEEGTDIIVMAVHPGMVLTEGNNVTARRIPWPFSALYKIICYFWFESVQSGVGTSCVAVGAHYIREEADRFKGAYVVPYGKVGEPSKQSQDDGLARELWETTEGFLKEWNI